MHKPFISAVMVGLSIYQKEEREINKSQRCCSCSFKIFTLTHQHDESIDINWICFGDAYEWECVQCARRVYNCVGECNGNVIIPLVTLFSTYVRWSNMFCVVFHGTKTNKLRNNRIYLHQQQAITMAFAISRRINTYTFGCRIFWPFEETSMNMSFGVFVRYI